MVRIQKIRFLNIYAGKGDVYIVHNTHKPFVSGHTHIRNYNTAIYVAQLTAFHRIPKNCSSEYLIQSLIRLSEEPDRIQKLKSLLPGKRKKKGRKH